MEGRDEACCSAPASSEEVLALHDVHHAYGSRATIAGLDLGLAAGEICCLLGPSGCGKTTVLRCIAGFERLRHGDISICRRLASGPGVHLPPEQRRIGMVFQDYALFPHLDVEHNIGFGLRGGREARERVGRLLETVGLASAARRYPHELSGGQQQRVALARALAPQPQLLLLDEPFSNLDVELREQLAAEVRHVLKANATSAVFVTHDQNEAFAMADRIAVMAGGRIEQIGSAHELYHRPRRRFVADFIGQGVFIGASVLAPQRLATELGEFATAVPLRHADDGSACLPGSKVELLLRPDDVVHDEASGVRARVRQRAFRGAGVLHTLGLPSGQQVLALLPSRHDHPVGTALGVRLALQQPVLFRPGTGKR